MFPLVRYFSLVSAVVVAIAMTITTVVLTETTKEQLIEERENANIGLTRIFSNSVWPQFRDHVRSSAERSGEELRSAPTTRKLLRSVAELMRGLPIVKVKVYALNGNTVFSTQASQMGVRKTDNPGFVSARNGLPISEMSNRTKFSAFENEIFDVDIIGTYIPIRDANGNVEAVFEVYDNVTRTLLKAEHRRNLIIAGVALLFALLYAALLMIVRRAARFIGEQHRQISQAKQSLEATNSRLENEISVREATQRDLEAAQATLVKQERLATLGELTATVSHELRNPLGVIRSSVFLVSKKTEDMELGLEAPLARAQRNVSRCDSIIRDLLGFASEPTSEPEQVEADAWLRETLADQDMPDDVRLVTEFGAKGVSVPIVPGRMHQAVVNILENAVQAMAEAPAVRPKRLIVRTANDGGQYRIYFEDTGLGMAAHTLEKIFEPLFSTKSYGCGLGLATVKKIVEALGGSVAVDSRVGDGTKVTLAMPLAQVRERAA